MIGRSTKKKMEEDFRWWFFKFSIVYLAMLFALGIVLRLLFN